MVVDGDGQQQDAAEEHPEPVAVDPGIEEAGGNNSEEQRPQLGAHYRPIAAGEQGSANDAGDDGFELLEQTTVAVGRAEVEDLRRSEHRGAERREYKELDLHAVD